MCRCVECVVVGSDECVHECGRWSLFSVWRKHEGVEVVSVRGGECAWEGGIQVSEIRT